MVLHKISHPTARHLAESGFTVIEILVVVALLAMISGLGLIVGMDSYRGYAFRADRDTLVSLLERARSQSINNICNGTLCTNGKPHGVFIDATSSQYILFQGRTYATRDVGVDEVTGGSGFITRSGISEVVFAQLSGEVSIPGAIVLSSKAGQTSTTSINVWGQIAWTN